MHRVLILVGLLAALNAHAARPAAEAPADVDAVVLLVPRAARSTDPSVLLAEAARSGDLRLVDRAEALLARDPARDSPLLRAWIAQHRHDFAGALALLDAALTAAPRDATARELRAHVLLTTGALRRAAADCAALALAGDAARGLLCTARLQFARGDTATGAELLERWLATAGDEDPRRTAALVLLAEMRAATDPAAAESRWREALARDPQDVRSLASFSRGLRSAGRAIEVLDLLPRDPAPEVLLLERALAASAAGALAERDRLREALARRAALREAAAVAAEPREDALRLLHLESDPRAALVAARTNFAQQREPEDIAVLVEAAQAVGDDAALAAVAQWRQREGVAPAVRP